MDEIGLTEWVVREYGKEAGLIFFVLLIFNKQIIEWWRRPRNVITPYELLKGKHDILAERVGDVENRLHKMDLDIAVLKDRSDK